MTGCHIDSGYYRIFMSLGPFLLFMPGGRLFQKFYTELKGILVGGPGPTKYEFIETGDIVTELKNKIIGVKDFRFTIGIISFLKAHGFGRIREDRVWVPC
jgi:hypothetical protein